jgi:hypothetical protein
MINVETKRMRKVTGIARPLLERQHVADRRD